MKQGALGKTNAPCLFTGLYLFPRNYLFDAQSTENHMVKNLPG